MVDRPQWRLRIRRALRRSRIVVLLGPRQSGKTTLARALVTGESPNSFDLEVRTSLPRLDQPMTALQGLRGTVAIDEIQRRADLFPVRRVFAGRVTAPE